MGMAGMPIGEYLDYPDIFMNWNLLFLLMGSLLSFVAFLLFIYIFFKALFSKSENLAEEDQSFHTILETIVMFVTPLKFFIDVRDPNRTPTEADLKALVKRPYITIFELDVLIKALLDIDTPRELQSKIYERIEMMLMYQEFTTYGGQLAMKRMKKAFGSIKFFLSEQTREVFGVKKQTTFKMKTDFEDK
jgi:hypothetical protein